MSYITEVVKTINSEYSEQNASAALISLAERASCYTPVVRRNQISKICGYAGGLLSEGASPLRKETYIIC